MNNETFLQIFGEIDDKIIQQANEDFNFWQESQRGIRVHLEYSRKAFWKTVITSAAGVAAVIIGTFVLLFNFGRIGIIDSPESSSDSSVSQSSADSEPDSEIDFYKYTVYAYERNSDTLNSYNVGDRFGDNAVITRAVSGYVRGDSGEVLKTQDIRLSVNLALDSGIDSFTFTGEYVEAVAAGSTIDALDLPSFGIDFVTEPLTVSYPTEIWFENNRNELVISALTVKVDYDKKTVSFETSPKDIRFFTHNGH